MEVKTGALWERKDEQEEPEEELTGAQSHLFLNRKAQREYRINELFRKQAMLIEKKLGSGDEEESESTKKPEVIPKLDDNVEEEEEKKIRQKRKV